MTKEQEAGLNALRYAASFLLAYIAHQEKALNAKLDEGQRTVADVAPVTEQPQGETNEQTSEAPRGAGETPPNPDHG